MKKSNLRILTQNKKASYLYFLSDFLEVGIELKGTEIKSLRQHGASLSDAYVLIKDYEAYVINMHIAPYDKGNIHNHDPLRNRKLLMHKHEINRYKQKIEQKGFTGVVTKVYLKHGLAKLEIALGKGKKLVDKRETIKRREDEREIKKTLKEQRKRY